MKYIDPIEKMLGKKLTTMRPESRDQLRAQLFKQAEQEFTDDKGGTSILSFIFMTMKRYSPLYIGSLLIATIAVYTFFEPSLKPEDVLAQVEESYQNIETKNDIYYEKILDENFHHGELYDSEIQELYLLDDLYNSITIDRNAETEAIDSVHFNMTDEYGDLLSGIVNYSGNDTYSNQSFDTFLNWNEAQHEWMETFKGEKVYCYDSVESGGARGESYLTLAAEDYSVFQTGGRIVGMDKNDNNEHEGRYQPIFEKMSESDSLDRVLKNLVDSFDEAEYDYELIKEGEQTYHLFKILLTDEGLPEYEELYYYYINPETFQLERYERYNGETLSNKLTRLDSRFIDPSEKATIFDPSRFEGLELEFFTSTASEKPRAIQDVNQSGCYDHEGQFISNSDTLPLTELALKEWEDMRKRVEGEVEFQSHIQQEIMEGFIELDIEFCGKNCNGPDWMPFVSEDQLLNKSLDEGFTLDNENFFPTHSEAVLTQGFRTAHKGIDLASREPAYQDIFAFNDGWIKAIGSNDQAGNYILIEHDSTGQIYETYYAHLARVDVEEGESIKGGQVIGEMGSTGRSTGPHLHFEIRSEGQSLNPLLFFGDDNVASVLEHQSKNANDEAPDLLDRELLDVFGETFTHFKWLRGYENDHFGLDFYTGKMGDQRVLAPADGVITVTSDEWVGDYGKMITMTHDINDSEIETLYAHLDSIEVSVGDRVKEGDTIGFAGNSGRDEINMPGMVQLHFEVRSEGIKVDPFSIFQK